MSENTAIRQHVIDLLSERDHVSFIEVMNYLSERGHEVTGEYAMGVREEGHRGPHVDRRGGSWSGCDPASYRLGAYTAEDLCL